MAVQSARPRRACPHAWQAQSAQPRASTGRGRALLDVTGSSTALRPGASPKMPETSDPLANEPRKRLGRAWRGEGLPRWAINSGRPK